MQYDPIKRSLSRFFYRSPVTVKLFYRLLDILLLRTWHVHRALKQFGHARKGQTNVQVLDAGSGFGQYTWYMARKNPEWHITGIDIKSEEIKHCQTFLNRTGTDNADFQQQDLTVFVKPESYDLILSVDVMEHIEDDQQVFNNFFRSLKPGGMLLISTPSDQGGSDVHHHDDASFIEEHVRDGYGIQDIESKLAKAGFRAYESRYTYGKPGRIAWRLSMKYPILMLSLSRFFMILLPVYYLLIMPLVLLLNRADVTGDHQSGTGLLVKAWKNNKNH